MKRTQLFMRLIISLLIGIPQLGHAVWLEGEGQADIIDGDVSAARQAAVQDALLTLMYRGEASVESIQVVKSGVLTTDSLTIRTNGEVHEMQILREDVGRDAIKIALRADIFPTKFCNKDKYLKTMFVGPFSLQSREHAQLGGLYRIGEAISQRIYRSFKLYGKRIDARSLMTQRIALETRFSKDLEPQLRSIARDISDKYDVQYIMMGNIIDMSSHNEVSTNILGIESSVKKRNFQVLLYVFDAVKGETILAKSYNTQREWPFDVTMKLDVTGETFWNSDYGQAINNILTDLVRDVESSVHCKESIAQVTGFMNDQLVINFGQKNGVKKGDVFKLVRQHYLINQSGITASPIFNQDETLYFTVSQVQADRSLLSTQRFSDLANVQIRDILVGVDQRRLPQMTSQATEMQSQMPN
jgi:hypothetical protein